MKIFLILTVFLIFFIHSSSSSLFNAFYLRDNRINHSKSNSKSFFCYLFIFTFNFYIFSYSPQQRNILGYKYHTKEYNKNATI